MITTILQGMLFTVVGLLVIPPIIALYRVFNDMPGQIASPRVMRWYYVIAWLTVIIRFGMFVAGGHNFIAFILPTLCIALTRLCEHDWSSKKPVVLDRQNW
jgi:hypothetical protein